jgi:uncharacterized membrane protein YkvA (DUF1232 family)
MKGKLTQLKEDIKSCPIHVKIVAGLCVAYLLSPIDLIPDFIPVIGQLDDLLLLAWLTKYVRSNIRASAL